MANKAEVSYTCPCCETIHLVFHSWEIMGFICNICGWEEDEDEGADLDFPGPNGSGITAYRKSHFAGETEWLRNKERYGG